jgi:MFS family permease
VPYLRLLRRHRDFALLWVGATLSVLGDGLTWVALVWLVFELGGGAPDVGLLVVAYTAPVIVGGLLAGLLLDRFDRRRVLIADNAIRGLAVASVPVATAFGLLEPSWLYGVAVVYGFFNMISLAGIPSMLPSLVDEDELTTANAMESLSYGVGGVAGPALGGLLIALVGAAGVLWLDALSYLAFVVALAAMRARQHPEPAKPGSRGLGPAFRFILGTPAVLAITLMFMAANVGEGMLLVLVPIYARDVLEAGSGTFGSLVSILTAGMLVGALVVGVIRWRFRLGRSIAAFQTAAGLSILGLALQPAFLVAATVLATFGLLVSPLTIWAQTIRMRLIPDELRGRVFGLLRTLMQSTPPIGGILAGFLLAGASVPMTVVAVSVIISVPGVFGLFHRSLAEA